MLGHVANAPSQFISHRREKKCASSTLKFSKGVIYSQNWCFFVNGFYLCGAWELLPLVLELRNETPFSNYIQLRRIYVDHIVNKTFPEAAIWRKDLRNIRVFFSFSLPFSLYTLCSSFNTQIYTHTRRQKDHAMNRLHYANAAQFSTRYHEPEENKNFLPSHFTPNGAKMSLTDPVKMTRANISSSFQIILLK